MQSRGGDGDGRCVFGGVVWVDETETRREGTGGRGILLASLRRGWEMLGVVNTAVDDNISSKNKDQ